MMLSSKMMRTMKQLSCIIAVLLLTTTTTRLCHQQHDGTAVVFVEGFHMNHNNNLPSSLVHSNRPPLSSSRRIVNQNHVAHQQLQQQLWMSHSNNNNNDSIGYDPPDLNSMKQQQRAQQTRRIGLLVERFRSSSWPMNLLLHPPFQSNQRRIHRVATSFAVAMITAWFGTHHHSMEVAHASAPVMAVPKAEGRDPVTEALSVHERKQAIAAQRELTEMAATARRIEAEHGETARIQYERDYKQQQSNRAAAKQTAIEQVKRDLLDQGYCPFTTLEGQRQVIALDKGIDLGTVQGTPFYLEKLWETKSPKKSERFQKATHRKIVACMVQDMKNRNIDPLDYFYKHQDQTEAIYDMKQEQAVRLLQQYETNLELYGQITVPKEGEVSAKERLAAQAAAAGLSGTSLSKEQAAQQRAQAKAEAAQAREMARAAKQQEQLERKAAQQAAKAESMRLREQAKAEAEAAAAAARATEATAGVVEASADTPATLSPESSTASVEQQSSLDGGDDENNVDNDLVEQPPSTSTTATTTTTATTNTLPAMLATPKVGATVVAVGGGAFAIKMFRDQAAAKEEERQRQFRLLMNGSSNNGAGSSTKTAPPLKQVDVEDETTTKPQSAFAQRVDSASTTTSSPAATPASLSPPPPKKKGLGIKNVFKKKSERETDLMVLVSPGTGEAPAFATTSAKLLSFGAPGRFPAVMNLPGEVLPDDITTTIPFPFDMAKDEIVQAQATSGLSLEQAAELFANVAHCMLIEMVDLASTSLKEKDDKITIDAINIVIDFMNHAASLFLVFADGVTIKPVTYGGDLSKAKLEQMYTIYAGSSMMGVFGGADGGNGAPDDFDSRLSLLQEVLQINEKKAQGLTMKAMQKSMMELMKDGKGLAGMEEMMKGMGGMDAFAGGLGGGGGADMFGANGEGGPSPEELKEMLTALKQMKDSGSIPPQEFDQVKKQFQEAFGASIDDVVKEAHANQQELSSDDRELVQLMKSIMDD